MIWPEFGFYKCPLTTNTEIGGKPRPSLKSNRIGIAFFILKPNLNLRNYFFYFVFSSQIYFFFNLSLSLSLSLSLLLRPHFSVTMCLPFYRPSLQPTPPGIAIHTFVHAATQTTNQRGGLPILKKVFYIVIIQDIISRSWW